jgi:hypothetical protein
MQKHEDAHTTRRARELPIIEAPSLYALVECFNYAPCVGIYSILNALAPLLDLCDESVKAAIARRLGLAPDPLVAREQLLFVAAHPARVNAIFMHEDDYTVLTASDAGRRLVAQRDREGNTIMAFGDGREDLVLHAANRIIEATIGVADMIGETQIAGARLVTLAAEKFCVQWTTRMEVLGVAPFGSQAKPTTFVGDGAYAAQYTRFLAPGTPHFVHGVRFTGAVGALGDGGLSYSMTLLMAQDPDTSRMTARDALRAYTVLLKERGLYGPGEWTETKVNLAFPRFKAMFPLSDVSAAVCGHLPELASGRPFGALLTRDLCLEKVYHFASLTADEEGATAEAVTVCGVYRSMSAYESPVATFHATSEFAVVLHRTGDEAPEFVAFVDATSIGPPEGLQWMNASNRFARGQFGQPPPLIDRPTLLPARSSRCGDDWVLCNADDDVESYDNGYLVDEPQYRSISSGVFDAPINRL